MLEIKYAFLDVLNIIKLRMKLLLSNRILFVTIILFFLMAAVTINTFFVAAKDKSTIPIGVVDLDDSSHSRLMIDNLKKNKLLKVNIYSQDLFTDEIINANENKLINKIERKEINALFIIKKGFGNNIENGKFEKIINDYYLEDKKYASLISDIVLSSILDDVCYNYSINKYFSLKN